jgi:hypothetical protein
MKNVSPFVPKVTKNAMARLEQRLTEALGGGGPHTHPQSDITNLVSNLAGKEPANANIQSHIASTSNPHATTAAQVGAAPTSHTHTPADVTGTAVITTDSRLSDARTPLTHTHPQSDIINLVGDLAGKEPANANIQSHIASAHAPSNAQKNSDILKSEIEAKLTGVISTHSHAGGGGISTLKKTADQIINGTAFQDITELTFPVVDGVDYAFTFYIVYRSAATTTGFRFSVNSPAGTLDFHMKYQTVANATTAGVATWLEGHWIDRDTMTALSSTITAGVDLVCIISGRFKCTANGTLAARVASELANNDLVVQKGSWGTYF